MVDAYAYATAQIKRWPPAFWFVCVANESSLLRMGRRLVSQEFIPLDMNTYVHEKRMVRLGFHLTPQSLADVRCAYKIIWIGEFLCDDVEKIPENMFIYDDEAPRNPTTTLPLTFAFEVAWATEGRHVQKEQTAAGMNATVGNDERAAIAPQILSTNAA